MCRHLALLAPHPMPVVPPLFGPGPSLERQSFAPAHQAVGRVNADGWGVGWWDHDVSPRPARYRTTTPIWADLRFREIAHLLRAPALVAAVRNATPGAPVEESGAAPFRSGTWLFSLNGHVEGFRDGLATDLRRSLPPERDAAILGGADAEVVFALVLAQLAAGVPPAEAVGHVITDLRARAGGRLNLLLSDGHLAVASRHRNELFTRIDHDGTVRIASEPFDDDPAWVEVPEDTVVVAALGDLRTLPL